MGDTEKLFNDILEGTDIEPKPAKIKKVPTIATTIRLAADFNTELNVYCAQRNMTKNTLVHMALREYMEKHK